MNILFMGSGDFALPILQKLHKKHAICAVYTAPFEQEKTRKGVINEVEVFAISQNIKIHKDAKITAETIATIEGYNPELIVVASYGFLLPQELLEIGTFSKPINIHPSSLPKWRGAAPIERAVEAGDISIDVCVIKMVKKMDAGDILIKKNIQISDELTATETRKITAEIGADLVLEWILNPNIISEKQDDSMMTHAKKIQKEELFLDFNQDVKIIFNKIRAFNGCGGCYFIHNNERVKILAASYEIRNNTTPGFVDIKNKQIHCNAGIIIPKIMQREGKKPMQAEQVWIGMR